MGIVREVLADFETPSGQQYRIELNESGTIHVHTEHVRIDLNRDEFVQFADAVSSGYDELVNTKDELQ